MTADLRGRSLRTLLEKGARVAERPTLIDVREG
jgi:hypothetical protein